MPLFIVSYNSMMAPKKEFRSNGKVPTSFESRSQSNALISLIVKRFPVKLWVSIVCSSAALARFFVIFDSIHCPLILLFVSIPAMNIGH